MFGIAVGELPGAPSLLSEREDGAGKGVGRWRCASALLPTPDLPRLMQLPCQSDCLLFHRWLPSANRLATSFYAHVSLEKTDDNATPAGCRQLEDERPHGVAGRLSQGRGRRQGAPRT